MGEARRRETKREQGVIIFSKGSVRGGRRSTNTSQAPIRADARRDGVGTHELVWWLEKGQDLLSVAEEGLAGFSWKGCVIWERKVGL